MMTPLFKVVVTILLISQSLCNSINREEEKKNARGRTEKGANHILSNLRFNNQRKFLISFVNIQRGSVQK